MQPSTRLNPSDKRSGFELMTDKKFIRAVQAMIRKPLNDDQFKAKGKTNDKL